MAALIWKVYVVSMAALIRQVNSRSMMTTLTQPVNLLEHSYSEPNDKGREHDCSDPAGKFARSWLLGDLAGKKRGHGCNDTEGKWLL